MLFLRHQIRDGHVPFIGCCLQQHTQVFDKTAFSWWVPPLSAQIQNYPIQVFGGKLAFNDEVFDETPLL